MPYTEPRESYGNAREEWGDYKLFEAIKTDMGGTLYHLTDRAHVDSIKKHGLLSCCEAEKRGVYPVPPGGNALTRALDAQRDLLDYVFLGFHENGLTPKGGELERLWEPVMVYVDPQIICWERVKVSLGRSTRSNIFDATRAYWKTDWEIFERPSSGLILRLRHAAQLAGKRSSTMRFSLPNACLLNSSLLGALSDP